MKGHAPSTGNSKNIVRAGLVLWIILIVLVVVSVFTPASYGGAGEPGDPRTPGSPLLNDLVKIDLSGFPIPAKNIPAHKNLILIPVAVSDFWGVKPFYVYKDHSWSSLNKVHHALGEQAWVKNEDAVTTYVPVVPLAAIVDLIPLDKELLGLKTDLKGGDFRAVASLGQRLLRFKEIHSEVYREGWQWFEPNDNCLETEFLPLMKKYGFNLVWPPSGTKDTDVLFRHPNYDSFTKTGEFRMI